MKIIQNLISRNYQQGRDGYLFIVPHTYGAKGTNLYNWFENPSAYASAHYSIEKDGTCRQYVADSDTAWACSNYWANRNSISIEFQDDGNWDDAIRTDALYQSGGELMAILSQKYLNSEPLKLGHNVKLHKDFVNKICPGNLDVQRLINIANNILKPIPMNPKAKSLYTILEKQRPDVTSFKQGQSSTPFYNVSNILDWWLNWGVVEYVQQLTYAEIKLPDNYTPDGLLSHYIDIVSKQDKNIWEYPKTKKGALTINEQKGLEALNLLKTFLK